MPGRLPRWDYTMPGWPSKTPPSSPPLVLSPPPHHATKLSFRWKWDLRFDPAITYHSWLPLLCDFVTKEIFRCYTDKKERPTTYTDKATFVGDVVGQFQLVEWDNLKILLYFLLFFSLFSSCGKRQPKIIDNFYLLWLFNLCHSIFFKQLNNCCYFAPNVFHWLE